MAPMRPSYVCLNCRLKARLNLTPVSRRFFSSCLRLHEAPRPPTAPKPTLNIRHIRENAELYSKNCVERNYKPLAEYPFRIKNLAEEAAQLDQALKTPRSKIKDVEKSIAKLATWAAQNQGQSDPDKSEELDALRLEAQRLKDETADLLSRRGKCTDDIQQLALSLPNLTSTETPSGEEPTVVEYINYDPASPPSYVQSPEPTRSHVSIGTNLGLLDFTSSATSTGWGWYFLVNDGALLEQALVQYALSVALRRGWKAVSPPTIVYSHIAEACGFQPRDHNNEQQIWAIEQSEKDKGKPQRSLAGTAEIPLAAMYAGKDIQVAELPVKLVGASRCYRAEAGARGVDTKGLYRVHEFTKVELFGWADADPAATISTTAKPTPTESVTSTTLFSEILSIQSEILSSLNLPCRILEMSSADLGASASRKRDIEVLFPSRLRRGSDSSKTSNSYGTDDGWGEVTSTSICTDYQSRRLATRVRGGSGGSRFPHTVNGTAMAVPRVLAAILENGWDEASGVVELPKVLRPYMGGMEVIGSRK